MSQHHRRAGWTQTVAKTHAGRHERTLPALCIQGCGRMITPDMVYGKDWEVGHIVDLAKGGKAQHTGPVHRGCNRSAGGRAGAAVTNASKAKGKARSTMTSNRIRNWLT
jgi:hypothetical protein